MHGQKSEADKRKYTIRLFRRADSRLLGLFLFTMIEYYKNLDLADIKYVDENGVERIEEWRDVIGYEEFYRVSNLGRVKSLGNDKTKKEKMLKTTINSNGYKHADLFYKGKRTKLKVHQLVAMAFLNHVPCGHKLVVNHIDFNRTNNSVDNLEIVTTRVNSNKKHLVFIRKSEYDDYLSYKKTLTV